MVKAHKENHRKAKTNVSRSHTPTWIVRATSLAKVVANSCNFFKFKRKILFQQRMGNLPIERAIVLSPPWNNVSFDLMRPVKVKSMVNERAAGKAWPLVICCLSTGAVHVNLMHTYGTEAFLLQWENFTALRCCSKQVWSDRGSQLTSSANYITRS